VWFGVARTGLGGFVIGFGPGTDAVRAKGAAEVPGGKAARGVEGNGEWRVVRREERE